MTIEIPKLDLDSINQTNSARKPYPTNDFQSPLSLIPNSENLRKLSQFHTAPKTTSSDQSSSSQDAIQQKPVLSIRDQRRKTLRENSGDPASYYRTLNELYEQKTTENLDLPLKLKQMQQKRMKIKLKREKNETD